MVARVIRSIVYEAWVVCHEMAFRTWSIVAMSRRGKRVNMNWSIKQIEASQEVTRFRLQGVLMT